MFYEDNTKNGFVFLVIFIALLKALKDYLLEIAIFLGIILIMAILGWIITFFLRHRKIRKVRQSAVIAIPSQTLYGIPMIVEKHKSKNEKGKIKPRWMVKSLRPELDNNDLSFVSLNYPLRKVKVLSSEPQQNGNYQTTKQISSLTKEIFEEIDPQLARFKQQCAELARLEKLVSSSEIYSSKAHLYKRARVNIQQLIDQAENLKREYQKGIKDILIGAEISQFDPGSLPDILERKLILQAKYESFKAEVEISKDIMPSEIA